MKDVLLVTKDIKTFETQWAEKEILEHKTSMKNLKFVLKLCDFKTANIDRDIQMLTLGGQNS